MVRALRDAAFAVLKFPFCVLGWLLWLLIGVPLALLVALKDGSGHPEGVVERAFERAAGAEDRTDMPAEMVDQAAGGWPGGFVSIWQFFYGE